MIHIIRFAGELNVFHYCHSSEEVGGEGRRGCRRRPPRATPALSRSSTLSLLVRESRDARSLRLTHSVRVCVPSRDPRSEPDRATCSAPGSASSATRQLASCRRSCKRTRCGASELGNSYAAADGSADRRAYCLRTHGECDRSLHARTQNHFSCLF
ncbi:unnamed protein product [Euphydryas editha]|uniref:Uncharacterized protein n=1 Tax=Euphydryas editha TaxID=104508 RepID=A0AAU9U9G8_EUPED|nr:unnamed protein product [Euphydryas editha]